MPPWPASTTEGGPFRDARVLSAAEIATLAAWVDGRLPRGRPEGRAAGPRPGRPTGRSATPDLVLTMPEPYTLDGRRARRVPRLRASRRGLTEGKWIAAIDFKPGNPKVVHHILAAFDIAGRARKLDEADPGPGYKVFGGFGIIPSRRPRRAGRPASGRRALPDGVGRYLPAGADVLLAGPLPQERQARDRRHARSASTSPRGRSTSRSRAGWSSRPAPGFFRARRCSIPAGDANYEVTGTLDDRAGRAPHRRRSPTCTGSARTSSSRPPAPTARPSTLIRIDHWNFNWQGTYDFVDARRAAEGDADRDGRPLRQLGRRTRPTRARRRRTSAGASRRPTRCASASCSGPSTTSTARTALPRGSRSRSHRPGPPLRARRSRGERTQGRFILRLERIAGGWGPFRTPVPDAPGSETDPSHPAPGGRRLRELSVLPWLRRGS